MSKKWYMLIWLLLVTAGVLASQENPFKQTGGVITLYFEVSSEELPEEEKGKVDAVGKYLEERPEEKIVVEGNAAPFDSEELRYNMGYERAENVKNYLLEQYQISEKQIQVRSEGSKRSAGFVEGQDNAPIEKTERYEYTFPVKLLPAHGQNTGLRCARTG